MTNDRLRTFLFSTFVCSALYLALESELKSVATFCMIEIFRMFAIFWKDELRAFFNGRFDGRFIHRVLMLSRGLKSILVLGLALDPGEKIGRKCANRRFSTYLHVHDFRPRLGRQVRTETFQTGLILIFVGQKRTF